MKKTILSASVAALLAVPALSAMAEEAASPLSFNVGVTSDYIFRGISQTHGDAALQGGVDYAFSNGFYVGAWGSNVSWVKDALGKGSMEVDLYGGYKAAINDDWSYDLGVIAYTYPGHGKYIANSNANPNTTEVYGALSWKWLTAKYSYVVSPYFVGWYGGANTDKKTNGSDYIELNANYDLGDGWTAIGHVGHQNVANSVKTNSNVKSASYSDWKLGVSKDVGFGVVTLAYTATDTTGACTQNSANNTNPYCWGTNGNGNTQTAASKGFKDVSKDVVTVSFTKAF